MKKQVIRLAHDKIISKQDVEYVARLARLELTEAEKDKFTGQLEQILEHAAKIKEIDTTSVQPTSHVVPVKNVFREDKAGPTLTREEALSNAPAKEDGAFVVPKIV